VRRREGRRLRMCRSSALHGRYSRS
jgi:hypothetical protein